MTNIYNIDWDKEEISSVNAAGLKEEWIIKGGNLFKKKNNLAINQCYNLRGLSKLKFFTPAEKLYALEFKIAKQANGEDPLYLKKRECCETFNVGYSYENKGITRGSFTMTEINKFKKMFNTDFKDFNLIEVGYTKGEESVNY